MPRTSRRRPEPVHRPASSSRGCIVLDAKSAGYPIGHSGVEDGGAGMQRRGGNAVAGSESGEQRATKIGRRERRRKMGNRGDGESEATGYVYDRLLGNDPSAPFFCACFGLGPC
jgi:hypothetical protein